MRDYTPSRLERARSLRRTDADAEMRLWQALRSRQLGESKFRRQHPVGPFVADFVCLAANVVIEVDGAHHAEQRAKDDARTRFIESQGFRVIRFDDGQVLNALDAVLEVVRLALEGAAQPAPHPHPLPVNGAREPTNDEPSPRLRGEGRVRGNEAVVHSNSPPHPNPPSATGARERTSEEPSPRSRGEGRVRGNEAVVHPNSPPSPQPSPRERGEGG